MVSIGMRAKILREQSAKGKLTSFKATLSQQRQIADYLRERSWKMIADVQSGHLGGPSSSSELVTALYFGGNLHIDLDQNRHENRDRVLIRGHLAPLRYCLFNLFGWISNEELKNYRQFGSRLHGHEIMGTVPGIDITPSGALGMVLSYGVGSAIDAVNRRRNYNTIVFLGDGEEQEGNVAEAARHAAVLSLNRLFCIIDRNGKQLSRSTSDVDAADLQQTWAGYGWETFQIIDGHDLEEVNEVYERVFKDGATKPSVVIANTIKGNKLPGAAENCCGYHTINAFGGCELRNFVDNRVIAEEQAMKDLVRNTEAITFNSVIADSKWVNDPADLVRQPEQYTDNLAVELASLFTHCADLMEKGYPLYVITADLMPSDETKGYRLEGRTRYLDVGIREQHMFALAHGLSVTDPDARIIIKSHDSFIYRAADQIQAISLGGSRVIVVGDYGGLSGNYNGETHQSTGQPCVMLMMPGAAVFEPADAEDFWRVANHSLVNNPGLVYIRLFSREARMLPKLDEGICYYRTHEPSDKPKVVLISAGLTAFDALMAGKQLDDEGIPCRVVNVVSLKATQCKEFASLIEDGVVVLTVYNGHPLILQSLVSTAVMRFCRNRPITVEGHGFAKGVTGGMAELKTHFGLDPYGIVRKAKELLHSGSGIA